MPCVCPRCGSYLARLLAHFDELFEGLEPVTLDTPLENAFEGDSLRLIEYAMKMEDDFGVTLSTEELENVHTIGDMVRYLTGPRDYSQE